MNEASILTAIRHLEVSCRCAIAARSNPELRGLLRVAALHSVRAAGFLMMGMERSTEGTSRPLLRVDTGGEVSSGAGLERLVGEPAAQACDPFPGRAPRDDRVRGSISQ